MKIIFSKDKDLTINSQCDTKFTKKRYELFLGIIALVFIIAITFHACTKYETPPGKTANLKGRVIDSITSTPIDSSYVILVGSAGAYDTTRSRVDGTFVMGCPMSCTSLLIDIHFRKAGYQDKNVTVELISEQTVDMGDVRLRP
ncbi:MAG: hypothetical protein NTV87_11890 [Ignavibacteriae bacterium]|nr:hypothetical protein [Ignavibacteriota bacterium]